MEDFEPVYCYKSLGGVTCYEKPYHRDKLRLVNFFGPAPERYDPPPAPEPQKRFAPQMVNYWVKDPEPIPRPAPQGDLVDRPWLTPEGKAAERAAHETLRLSQSEVGTRVFLRKIGAGEVRPAANFLDAALDEPADEREMH